MPAPLAQRLLLPVGLAGVLLAVLFTSPPALLTTYPPVYHDEYDLMAPAIALLDGEGLALPLFGSTPALAQAFQGQGSLTPGLGAGFHVALALWFKIFGIGIRAARAFVFVMGLLAIAAVLYLGARWASRWAGLAAALLLALDGTFWYASRQVRPETFTAAAYLGGACLLSIADERWRNRFPELAGVAIGLGLCGHPFGAVMAPVVLGVPLLVARGLPPLKYLLRLGLPIALMASTYGAFLVWNWGGVQENLALNALHRAIDPVSFTERIAKEWHRYEGGYFNAYAQALGVWLQRVAFGGWILLLACAVIGRVRRGRGTAPLVGVALFAAAPAMVIVVMGILSRDTANFLYLVHFLAWLYLAGPAGIVALGRLLVRPEPAGARRWMAAIGYALLAVLAVAGMKFYGRDLAPYAERPVMPYEEVESLLASHIPPGAFVIANENAWLAARAAGAEFVFNKQYVQYLPPYRRYPVRAAFDGSHLVEYALDIEMLEELREAGTEIFYVSDMWDWSWNLYAPFGRYASSFLSFQKQLDASFVPVLRIYTRDRGFVSLYKFAPHSDTPPGEPTIYLEGTPHRLGPEIPPAPPLPPDTNIHVAQAGRITPIADFAMRPGRAYLLHLNLRVVEGSTVIPVWNNTGLPKHVDARVSIFLDQVVHARGEGGKLALLAYPDAAVVRLEQVQLRELAPCP